MKKKILPVLLALGIMGSSTPIKTTAAEDLLKNQINISIEDMVIEFPTVLYKEENYLKLRDFAYVIKDYKEIEVEYKKDENGKNKIYIKDGKYTPKGDELKSEIDFKGAVIGTETLSIGNKDIQMSKVNVKGYNYFRLRDLAKALGLDVSWNKESRSVRIKKMGEMNDGKIQFRETATEKTEHSPILLVKDAGEGNISITYSVKVNTGGYSLKTKSVKRVGNKIIVTPDLIGPPADAMVTQVISYPTTTIIISKAELPEGYVIEIEGEGDAGNGMLSDR
ncbi:MAG: protease complex subunit PrcB family protein [Ezakiella coagulans]|uniref:protease complex subunit PrcB family protein n=1 Tax=Ezakiella coagulans TaxID=46507 RepID=UPI00399C0C1D